MAPLPLCELELGGYWTDGPYRMLSAQGHVQENLWDQHIGKSGKIWLIPHGEEANSQVIVAGEPGSRGFGGSELTFKLFDGGEVKLKGPWSSNHDAFFADCGIDRREHFRTWGCIGRHRGYHPSKYDSRSVICDLVYWDPPEGVIGSYSRIEDLASLMAYQRDEVLFYFQGTYGGSSSGPRFPHEGTSLYREYRMDRGSHVYNKWHNQIELWKAGEKPYWDRYRTEFIAPETEWGYKGPGGRIEQSVPLDEELELNPPPPPKPEVYDDEYDEDGERYY